MRGRIGYAFDRAMVYATGGWAWTRNDLSLAIPATGIAVSERSTHSGWVLGGGIEWALVDNWTAKVEYQYLALGSANYLSGTVVGGLDVDADVHTIRIGLNYRFGGGKAPVVAKY